MKRGHKILLLLVFSIFLINSVSAVIRTYQSDGGFSLESKSVAEGVQIKTNNYALFIQNFTKSSSSDATHGYILHNNATIIRNTTVLSGDVFSFTETQLQANTYYFIVYDKNGATYTTGNKVLSHPVDLVDASATAGGNDCTLGTGPCGNQTGNSRMIIDVGMSNISLATPPTITLSTPEDNFNSTISQVTFNATVSDDNGVSFVRLYGNFSGTFTINSINTSGINNSQYKFTLGLSNGYYIWSYWTNDSNNNAVFSSNRTLTVIELENATFENVNVTNNLTIGNNVSASRGFFNFLGSSISRIVKGWFTELDVSGTTNLTGQTYLQNASCSAGQVLTTNSNGLVLCTNMTKVKSGSVSVTEGTPTTVTFTQAFQIPPYCTVSVDLSGSGSAVKGMAFLTNAPNTTSIRIDWDDTAGGVAKTENLIWICTDAGNP